MMVVTHIDEPSTPFDSRHQDSAKGGPLLWVYGQGIFFGQFWKLGFCLVRDCQIFADGGQLRIFIDREHVASVTIWNMPKHACMTCQKLILM